VEAEDRLISKTLKILADPVIDVTELSIPELLMKAEPENPPDEG
jgi:hypothetical protein